MNPALKRFFTALGRRIATRRFKAMDIALAILLAGWVPSILMATVSYSILSRTLESKIIVDRSTLVRTLSLLLGLDVRRTGDVMAYYQKHPLSRAYALRAPGDPQTQRWLSESFFPMGWIDGMFLTDASGKLLAASPLEPELIGRPYLAENWIEGANAAKDYHVSAIHQRLEDGRFVTSIVVALRSDSGETIGYMGADILVERIGRRLSGLELGDGAIAQVYDQNGFPLFTGSFEANIEPPNPEEAALFRQLLTDDDGHFTVDGDLFVATPIDFTSWHAVLEQPSSIVYQPVRDLLWRMGAVAAWLVGGTLIAALIVSQLYRRQLDADERAARTTLFNEKILANMPIGIALIDPSSRRFVQANQSFADMACQFGGWGGGCDIVGATFSDVRLGLDDKLDQVSEFGTPFHSSERKITAPDGSVHHFTINLLRLQDSHRRTQGALLLLDDKTADVTRREELIAANTAKDQFLALLSHELRNPLSPVITMVAELERLTESDPAYREPLEVIRRNVELEARLIDDLLDITRITHSKLQLNRQHVDIHEILQRAVEICESDIQEKNLALRVDLAAERHHAWADPARLQQVFWNVIKNSVKFTAEGSITIRSENRDGSVLVTIEDTGLGIEPERIGKIFNAFEQGGSAITRQFGGLGLGLAISHAMIVAHDGEIIARSEGKGKGAAFAVELPTISPRAEDEIPEPSPSAEPTRREGRRILLVDDHVDTCRGMRKLLERRGYMIEVAHNVADALTLADKQPFDLLISDLGLPDATGFELMEQVRDRHGMRGIALSGFGMESDIQRSREAGFVEHMIKPVNIDRLDEALQKLF